MGGPNLLGRSHCGDGGHGLRHDGHRRAADHVAPELGYHQAARRSRAHRGGSDLGLAGLLSCANQGGPARPTTTLPLGGFGRPLAVLPRQRHLHAEANRQSRGQGWKSIQVEVSWVDRAGQAQSVTLSSVIAGADPALSGVLSTVPAPVPVRQPLARNPGRLPRRPWTLGGGKSAYRPPGAPQATVWVFDNPEPVSSPVFATSRARICRCSCPPTIVSNSLPG